MGCIYSKEIKKNLSQSKEFIINDVDVKKDSDRQSLKRAKQILSIINPDEENYKFKNKENKEIPLDSINSSFFKGEILPEKVIQNDPYEDIVNIGNLIKERFSLDNEGSKNNSSSKRSSLFKKEEPIPLITEKDNFFEEILREKLLKKSEEENFMLNLIHLDELKIPFPKDLKKFDDELYTSNCICEIEKKLKGKYKIEKGNLDTLTRESVIDFVNKKEENVSDNIKNILLKNKYVSEQEIYKNYVGINFKNIDKDTYVIYYLFAVEKN